MSDPNTIDLGNPMATERSTPTYYSLWDVDSGNSLGTYDTQEQAMYVMRLLIEANGVEYAPFLDLGFVDETGEGVSVGTGETLFPDLVPRLDR